MDAHSLTQALADAHRRRGRLDPLGWRELARRAAADPAQAFEIQHQVGGLLGWWPQAGRPTHWKSGSPHPTIFPVHAPLAAGGVWQCAEGSPPSVDLSGKPLPGGLIEAEIAFRLRREVGPEEAATLDLPGARTLIDGQALAVEFVQSRWDDSGDGGRDGSEWDAPSREWLALADGLSHGALVLGPWLATGPVDWSALGCSLQISGHAPVETRGSHPLGDPTWLLPAWLRHLTRQGQAAAAGSVVTTGSWTGVMAVRPGDTVTLRFAGLGTLTIQL